MAMYEIEICAVCQRVVKDDRYGFRDWSVFRYRWTSETCTALSAAYLPFRLLGTVCTTHLPHVNYNQARYDTNPCATADGNNAMLPTRYWAEVEYIAVANAARLAAALSLAPTPGPTALSSLTSPGPLGPPAAPAPRSARVWFGPPGVGKSTYVASVRGLDLERIHSHRVGAAHLSRAQDIGAADTQPGDYPPARYWRLLVLPPEWQYYERRRRRDRAQPAKAAQGDCYQDFARNASAFDAVLVDFPRLGAVAVHFPTAVPPLRDCD